MYCICIDRNRTRTCAGIIPNGFQIHLLNHLGHSAIHSTLRDSNPRPSAYKAGALPTELKVQSAP